MTVTVVQESPDERVGNVGNEERDFGETVVEQFVVVFSAHKTTQAIARETQSQRNTSNLENKLYTQLLEVISLKSAKHNLVPATSNYTKPEQHQTKSFKKRNFVCIPYRNRSADNMHTNTAISIVVCCAGSVQLFL